MSPSIEIMIIEYTTENMHMQAVPKKGGDPEHDAREKALLSVALRQVLLSIRNLRNYLNVWRGHWRPVRCIAFWQYLAELADQRAKHHCQGRQSAKNMLYVQG